MISEKKKVSNAKWDKENMTSLACRVKKDYAEKFKAACAEAGTTPNAVLKAAVDEFLKRYDKKKLIDNAGEELGKYSQLLGNIEIEAFDLK